MVTQENMEKETAQESDEDTAKKLHPESFEREAL